MSNLKLPEITDYVRRTLWVRVEGVGTDEVDPVGWRVVSRFTL